jgi:PAS domain-containing protein
VILGFARSQRYEPGTNLEGEQAEDAWLFLLPRLELRRVVLAGRPSPGTRSALLALGAELVEPARDGVVAALERPTDLLYVGADWIPHVARDPEAVAALDHLLAASGIVYLEPSSAPTAELGAALNISRTVELGSTREQLESEVEVTDVRAAWLVPRAHGQPSAPRRLIGRALRRATVGLRHPSTIEAADSLIGVTSVRRGTPRGTPDRGVLLRRDRDSPTLLPEYVRAVAHSCGHQLEDATWALASPRGYRSQKVVFHLLERREIVKVTQDTRFNPRLGNEYAALRALESRPLPDPAIAPKPLFCGQHAGLLVVGESRLEGVPFRRRSTGSASCPVARATVDTLIDLATVGGPGSGHEAAAALAALLEQYRHIHQPSSAHVRFLEGQIGRIAEAGNDFACAFSHGDPTTLNILVANDEAIRLVDWENAEPEGLPLWDLLHFVHAFAAWSTRLAGRRWTPAVAEATLFRPSPFRELLAGAIARYRAVRRLESELVPPLVFTFWIARALREATRRPPAAVADEHCARLLDRLVTAGETPELVALAHGRVPALI